MNPELCHWLFYDCFLSLFPIAIIWLALQLILGFTLTWNSNGPRRSLNAIVSILRDGQLFYYSTTLTAVAIGELTKKHDRQISQDAANWTPGFITILVASAVLYGVAILASQANIGKRFQGADERIAYFSSCFALSTTILVGYFRTTYVLW